MHPAHPYSQQQLLPHPHDWSFPLRGRPEYRHKTHVPPRLTPYRYHQRRFSSQSENGLRNSILQGVIVDLGRRLDELKALSLTTNDPARIVRHKEGESVTFLRGAHDTNGAYAFVRVVLVPNSGNDLHFHLIFAEIFEAEEGVLSIECDGQKVRLGPGERATAPIGSHHRFSNETDQPITFLAIIQPARRFEEMLRVTEGLKGDGGLNEKGFPKSILQLGIMFEMGESYLAGMPLWLQQALFGPLAAIARWRKVDRDLAKYVVARPAAPAASAPMAAPTA